MRDKLEDKRVPNKLQGINQGDRINHRVCINKKWKGVIYAYAVADDESLIKAKLQN